MSFAARIEHTPAGLALTFGAPLSRLDMAPDVAEHLASLLVVEARHRMRGVVSAVEKTNRDDEHHGSVATLKVTTHPLCCDCDPCLNGDRP